MTYGDEINNDWSLVAFSGRGRGLLGYRAEHGLQRIAKRRSTSTSIFDVLGLNLHAFTYLALVRDDEGSFRCLNGYFPDQLR